MEGIYNETECHSLAEPPRGVGVAPRRRHHCWVWKHGDHRAKLVVEHEGGNRKTYRGCYLVGADGARSTIRKVIGVEFEKLCLG